MNPENRESQEMSGGAPFECQDLGRHGRKRDNVGRPCQIWLRTCRRSILLAQLLLIHIAHQQRSPSVTIGTFKDRLLSFSNV